MIFNIIKKKNLRKHKVVLLIAIVIVTIAISIVVYMYSHSNRDRTNEVFPTRIALYTEDIESITFAYINWNQKKFVTRTSDIELICALINETEMVFVPGGDASRPKTRSGEGGGVGGGPHILTLFIHEITGHTRSVSYHSYGDEDFFTTDSPNDIFFSSYTTILGHDGNYFIAKPESLVYAAFCNELFELWFVLDYDIFT